MKTIIFMLIIVLYPLQNCYAQNFTQKEELENHTYKNYIGLQGGIHVVSKYFTRFPPISTMGINYQRQVHNKFYAELTYMMWLPSEISRYSSNWVTFIPNGSPYKVGQHVASEDFKMIDVSGLYSFLKPESNHMLIAGLGLSRYWGYNYHIEYIWIFNPEAYERDERVKESFWGVCWQTGYRYSFLRKKISVGLTYKYRHIFNPKMNAESNYLITLGYNL